MTALLRILTAAFRHALLGEPELRRWDDIEFPTSNVHVPTTPDPSLLDDLESLSEGELTGFLGVPNTTAVDPRWQP